MASSHGGPLAATLHDLQQIFGDRLQALVAHGRPDEGPAPSLAIVRSVTADDLAACAARAPGWLRGGSATPLILSRDEFAGSLDAFPIEFGEIIDTHQVIFGADPFVGLSIRPEDLRRACEVQVKSHLLHLRENYIECGARPAEVASLVAESAPGFAALLRRLASLDGRPIETAAELSAYAAARPGLDPRVVGNLIAIMASGSAAGVDAVRLFPGYLAAVEQLARFIDGWKHA
jgi:hypothetical protein